MNVAGTTRKSMRRFEWVDSASSKFWEVELNGCDVTVRFGRIGSNGQLKTRSLADAAAAAKVHDTLIREKTGKGYREAKVALAVEEQPPCVAASAPLPDRADGGVADAAKPAPTVPANVVQARAPGAGPLAEPLPIEWPEGGIDWSEELSDALPMVRGTHVTALRDYSHLVDHPLDFQHEPENYDAQKFDKLAAAIDSKWVVWDVKTARRKLELSALRQADIALWLECCAQCLYANLQGSLPQNWSYEYRRIHGLSWVTKVGTELHGVRFMMAVAIALARGAEKTDHEEFKRVLTAQFDGLQLAIAATDEATHQEVVDWLELHAASTPLDRMLRALLCPHRTDWALQSMAEDRPFDQFHLRWSIVPPATMRRYMKTVAPDYAALRTTIALQIRLHADAGFDLVADMLDRNPTSENAAIFVALLMRLRTPRGMELLAARIERKDVRDALDTLATRYPAAVLKCVAGYASASHSRVAENWALRFAQSDPVACASAMAAMKAGERQRFASLLEERHVADAGIQKLPLLLRDPPWLGKRRAIGLPVLELAELPTVGQLEWSAESRAQRSAYQITRELQKKTDTTDKALDHLRIGAVGRARVLAGEPLPPDDPGTVRHYHGSSPATVLMLPDPVALAVWNSYPARYWYDWHGVAPPVRAILARFGPAALPGLCGLALEQPDWGLWIAIDVDSAAIVPIALAALSDLRKSQASARTAAMAWLKVHPETTFTVALPQAFGKQNALRTNIRSGVRWLARQGFADKAQAVAARYGGKTIQALQALLDFDPLYVLPTRMPTLPNFFVATSFARPVLRDGGGALPLDAVQHIGSMLAISKLEVPYAGLAIVKQACTPGSLAAFAWDLYEAWLADGAASKHAWAFTALGLLGDDETALCLVPRIRDWPGEGLYVRAATGLDLLAAIGSDAALMHLDMFANKAKNRRVKERAAEKLTLVAEARGFTAEDLSDRLVPCLGLNPQGTLRLDFGPRQFLVHFEETLRPFVRDADGVRLPDLPKPNQIDDAVLAEAASNRFKQLKKDAKAVASLQLIRLESAMVRRRRWTAAEFRSLFLRHPLLRHLVAHLIWGVYDDGGTMTSAFRIADDWSLADAEDQSMTLADDVLVGVAHVLEMPLAMRTAFGQALADYKIRQPFQQMGRETYALSDTEMDSGHIDRFAQKLVSSGSLLGLSGRGWARGDVEEHVIEYFNKKLGGGLEFVLEIEPGIVAGDPAAEPAQRVLRIELRQIENGERAAFDKLHPVTASELLRDAELLVPYRETVR